MKIKNLFPIAGFIASFSLASCSTDEPKPPTILDDPDADGLFVICEGNWGYGNSSITFYNTNTNSVDENIFQRANGMKLGDTAESMTIHNDLAWVVVNTSGVIFAIDEDTYIERGRIENLTSPRYIHFVNDEKAYVTDMYSYEVLIINPKTYSVTGSIAVDSPAEEMVQAGKYVYTNSWSYGKIISKIDSSTDKVVATLEVGVQPKSMALDNQNRLWVLCDGGSWEQNPVGYEAPTLVCVNLDSFTVEKSYFMTLGDSVSHLVADGDGRNLYWLNGGVYKMSVDASALPSEPFITKDNVQYYGLTVNPDNGDIYFSDAVDYMQNGRVYRYKGDGSLANSFTTGVCPANFCWKD